MRVVGDVLGLLLDGMTDLSIFACCFGSFCVASMLVFSVARFAFRMSFLSLFLHRACFFMFSGVGWRSRV